MILDLMFNYFTRHPTLQSNIFYSPSLSIMIKNDFGGC